MLLYFIFAVIMVAEGYVKELRNMIHIPQLKKTFIDTENYCKSLRMRLPRPEYKAFINYLFNKTGDYWVDVQSQWTQRDGAPYEKYVQEYMGLFPKLYVVMDNKKLKWRRSSEDSLAFVVCFKDKLEKKYEEIVEISTTKRTMNDAKLYCEADNMKLVTSEAFSILNYLQSRSDDYWIDVKYDNNKGEWLHKNVIMTKSQLWEKNEPKNEKCAVVCTTNLKWKTRPCKSKAEVICYKDYFYYKTFSNYEDASNFCISNAYGLLIAVPMPNNETVLSSKIPNHGVSFWVKLQVNLTYFAYIGEKVKFQNTYNRTLIKATENSCGMFSYHKELFLSNCRATYGVICAESI